MFADQAYDLAEKAHAGQKRRNGDDYFAGHVVPVYKRVLFICEDVFFSDQLVDEALSVALLHDVLEDTNVTVKQLQEIFPDRVVAAVVLLTKKNNEEYASYIIKLCELYENSHFENGVYKMALIVKLCDLDHNMSDFTEDDKRGSQYAKYKLAKYLIERTLE